MIFRTAGAEARNGMKRSVLGMPACPLSRAPSVARYVMPMVRTCEECGARLPRPAASGRLARFCSGACRRRADRARGGRASGTTGAQRRPAVAGERAYGGESGMRGHHSGQHPGAVRVERGSPRSAAVGTDHAYARINDRIHATTA